MPRASSHTSLCRRSIEPLIFLAAIALLVLLLLPVIHAPRSRARHPCIGQLRAISTAITNYEVATGRFPPRYLADANGHPMHSWRILILPYLDDPSAREIYAKYRWDEPWNGPNNRRLAAEMPNVFRCPSEHNGDAWHTSYVAIVHPESIWASNEGTHVREVKDGTSHTLLLIEQPQSGVHWMEPRDVKLEHAAVLDPDGPRNHAPVVMASFADGHTRFLVAPLREDDLRSLVSIAANDGIDGHEP